MFSQLDGRTVYKVVFTKYFRSSVTWYFNKIRLNFCVLLCKRTQWAKGNEDLVVPNSRGAIVFCNNMSLRNQLAIKPNCPMGIFEINRILELVAN